MFSHLKGKLRDSRLWIKAKTEWETSIERKSLNPASEEQMATLVQISQMFHVAVHQCETDQLLAVHGVRRAKQSFPTNLPSICWRISPSLSTHLKHQGSPLTPNSNEHCEYYAKFHEVLSAVVIAIMSPLR